MEGEVEGWLGEISMGVASSKSGYEEIKQSSGAHDIVTALKKPEIR
jgi:hypothetical protein